jgi:glyoxylase-like metal-dependent hydrolase (beta-lactamase superfamily II)
MRFLLHLVLAAATASAMAAQSAPIASVQLYTLDCGRLDFPDMGDLSDTGENAGKPGTLAVPCYLIHHGKDWMLWDTGLGDKLASKPNGEIIDGGRFSVRRTLASQLAEIGLTPDSIRYVALSHLHLDHCGNIGLFPHAIFLIPDAELTWARRKPASPGVVADLIAPLARAHIDANNWDRDVFGDGSVKILEAPGHTPGSRILLVTLAKSGPILISGDLYHTRENYEKGLVPNGNYNRAETLASFNRFAGIQKNTHARVIVEHAPEDFAAMPVFPKFLD